MKVKQPVVTESKSAESKIGNGTKVNMPPVKEVVNTSVNNTRKAISKIKNDTQDNKTPAKEAVNTPVNNIQKKEEIQKPAKNTKPVMVAKSGNADLRRGERELAKVVKNIGLNPHDGTMYAFSNMKNNVKILQEKNNCTVLTINKTKTPIKDCPEYKPRGEAGHTVTFSGEKLKQFKEKIGISTN